MFGGFKKNIRKPAQNINKKAGQTGLFWFRSEVLLPTAAKNTRLDGMYFHRKVQRCLFLLLLFTEITVDGCFEVRQHPAGDRIKQDKR